MWCVGKIICLIFLSNYFFMRFWVGFYFVLVICCWFWVRIGCVYPSVMVMLLLSRCATMGSCLRCSLIILCCLAVHCLMVERYGGWRSWWCFFRLLVCCWLTSDLI